MWPDNETSDDLIGFRVHADLIRAVVTNPKMLPTIIGVFGDWGGGKTSIMKMLENDLTPEVWPADSPERSSYENVAVLFFNTWLFEGYDDSKSAILASVLLQLGEHKRFGPKVRDNVVSLLKSVNWMRLGRLGLKHIAVPAAAAFLTGGAAAIPMAFAALAGVSILKAQGEIQENEESQKSENIDWGELIKKSETSTDAPDVRTFRSRFEKMLKDADITSMVVLIDDLDRCTPERIIENLEAIKLFMNVAHTAFVVGADPRIVEHAIRSRYAERALDNPRDREESDRLVKDYLEKVVQVPYHLPRLSAAEIETYMVLLFCQHHLTEEEFALCRKACEEERTRNRYSTF
jgi:predicted KAP-like P-loop ATPase